jgi:hypothetical protein
MHLMHAAGLHPSAEIDISLAIQQGPDGPSLVSSRLLFAGQLPAIVAGGIARKLKSILIHLGKD